MYNQMNLIIPLPLLILSLTFQYALAASSNLTRVVNRDFITGQYVIPNSDFVSNSQNWQSLDFQSPYLSTIQSPIEVYYTTNAIDAHTFSGCNPYSLIEKNIEYLINSNTFSKISLKTTVTGYLYGSQITWMSYKFLIVLANNRIFGSHVTIATISFTNTNPIYTAYPTSYSAGDNIDVLVMLRDLRVAYFKFPCNANNQIFQFAVSNSQLDIMKQVQSKITVSPFFTNNIQIRFLVLVIDQSAMQADFRKYYRSIKQDINVVSGSTANSSLGVSVKKANSAYITGISSLKYINSQQPSFYFNIDESSTSNSFLGDCKGTACSLNFSYWILIYRDCKGPQWINQGYVCYDNCTSLEYFDFSDNTCKLCPVTCLTCYDENWCSSCDASHKRILEDVSCVPIFGYYQDGSAVAPACHSSCVTCNGGSATDCTSCHNTSILVTGTCKICSFIFQGCAICNSTDCLSCSSPYRQINQTYCNLPCADSRCQVCLNSNLNFCLSCQPTHTIVLNSLGQCAIICGDGIVFDKQQCDDGNLNNHDGCNQFCMSQQYYTCNNLILSSGQLHTAYCSYHQGLNFSLLSQQKLESSNSLRFILTVQQHEQSFWKSFQTFDGFISPSVKHSNLTAKFISQWSFDSRLLLSNNEISPRVRGFLPQQYFQIVFEYHEQLHNLPLSLSFAFGRSNDPRVNTIPLFNQTFIVLPQNNQYAHLYLPETYSQQSLLKKIITIGCIVLIVAYMIACFFRCKRFIADTIMVFQIGFVGLATVQWANPLHMAVKSLSILLNPFNLLYSQSYRPFDDPLLPNRLRNMGLYSNILSNLNSGLLYVMLPLLVGVILKLISLFKCIQEKKRDKLSEYGRAWLTDFMLAGITMLGCGFGCNLALEINYAIADLNYSGITSVVLSGILSLLFLVYIFVWLKGSNLFAEYEPILQKGPFSLIFTLVYSYSGFFVSFTSFMLFQHQYITIIIISYSVLLLLLIVFKPIYLKSRDNIRIKINLLTIILTQSAYLIDRFYHGYSHLTKSSLFMAATMIIPLVLALNLIVNLGYVSYEFVKIIREWMALREKKKMESDEKQYISQKSVEMKKIFQNSQQNPIITISQAKYKNPLLDVIKVNQNADSAKVLLREELTKFLEVERIQAQRIIKNLSQSPKHQAHLVRKKYKEKSRRQILGVEYKELQKM